jgi:hypothetical protein
MHQEVNVPLAQTDLTILKKIILHNGQKNAELSLNCLVPANISVWSVCL